MKTRYLSALMAVYFGSTLSTVAFAQGASASVDFGVATPPAIESAATTTTKPKPKLHGHVKRTRDPLKVDASIAVKNTPQKEIVLPGVLTVPGEGIGVPDPSNVQKVSWTNTGNKTVYLSADEPNRILLPFKNAYIVHTSDVQVDKREQSNNVYVYWTNAPSQARHLYIEPPDGVSARSRYRPEEDPRANNSRDRRYRHCIGATPQVVARQ